MSPSCSSLLGSLALCVFVLGCGQRSASPGDAGADHPRLPRTDLGHDEDAIAIGTPDRGAPVDARPAWPSCGGPLAAKSNSTARCSQSCSTDADCVPGTYCATANGGPCTGGQCQCNCSSADEVCAFPFQDASGAEVGMCLGKCCKPDPFGVDAPGTCPVADPIEQKAYCLVAFSDSSGRACLMACEIVEGSTVHKLACPGAEYDCVADPSGGALNGKTTKITAYCVPKASKSPPPPPADGWHLDSSPTTVELWAVWGSSATDVFAVGDWGTIVHHDGASWKKTASITTAVLKGVWGSSPTNVYAVGTGGAILRYDGASWKQVGAGIATDLKGVWGSSPTDVFAVGGGGTVLHFDGTSWSPLATPKPAELAAVWGTSATDVVVAASFYGLLHFDGTSFTWLNPPGDYFAYFTAVWGSAATDIWVAAETDDLWVGDYTVMYRYDGKSWTEPPLMYNGSFRGLWGSSAVDVYASGLAGLIFHYNGTGWAPQASGTGNDLYGVWGSAGDDVFIVGAKGTILHRHP